MANVIHCIQAPKYSFNVIIYLIIKKYITLENAYDAFLNWFIVIANLPILHHKVTSVESNSDAYNSYNNTFNFVKIFKSYMW